MMFEFVDTHTHVTDEAFKGEEEAVIERAVAAGVTHLLQADISSGERGPMREICRRHPGVLHPMLGLYPGSVEADWQSELALVEAADRSDVVAVGEVGLDYHFSTEFREEQKQALRIQLELASQWDLPVNIHLRDATGDFVEIIEDCRHLGLRGNLHAFSGSAEIFDRLLRSGDWYVGIGGVVTFKNAGIAKELERIPLERILLETDAPYLAPTPLRGTRNESSNIPLIAAKVAEIKGASLEEVAARTTSNAKKLFSI
mgnify:CR=1 FL=1